MIQLGALEEIQQGICCYGGLFVYSYPLWWMTLFGKKNAIIGRRRHLLVGETGAICYRGYLIVTEAIFLERPHLDS